jgi:hypothetical protein
VTEKKLKIKIFFVTYKNNSFLEKTFDTINPNQIQKYKPEIIVINNSPSFSIHFGKKYEFSYKVLNNNLRPDFSTGHLARNWNLCLINGFENINDPKSDIILCCQNDICFKSNFLDLLVNNHQKFNFISYGEGDAAHSYKIDAIKKVGLWDERFCNIGYQEIDYWIRNILYNKEKSSINDIYNSHYHDDFTETIYDKINNRLPYINNILETKNLITGFKRNCQHHIESMKYHDTTFNLLSDKWTHRTETKEIKINNQNYIITNQLRLFYCSHFHEKMPLNYHASIKQYVLYPYFENDIPNRKNIGYAN